MVDTNGSQLTYGNPSNPHKHVGGFWGFIGHVMGCASFWTSASAQRGCVCNSGMCSFRACASIKGGVSQPVGRSVSRSVSQSVSLSVSHLVGGSVCLSNSRTVNPKRGAHVDGAPGTLGQGRQPVVELSTREEPRTGASQVGAQSKETVQTLSE